MYCTKCGTKLEENDNFCKNCGEKVFKTNNFYEINESNNQENMPKNDVVEVEQNISKQKSLISIIVYFLTFYILSQVASTIIALIVCKINGLDLALIADENFMYTYPDVYATILSLTNGVIYTGLIIFIIIYLKDTLKHDFKEAFSSKKDLFLSSLRTFGILFAITYASGIIFNIFSLLPGIKDIMNDQSANQYAIDLMLKGNAFSAVVTIIMTVFCAPLLEEIIFRKCFFGVAKKTGFKIILISGLIFGGIHVFDALITETLLIIQGEHTIFHFLAEALHLITYVGSGLALSFCYYLNKHNLVPNIIAHALWNLMSVVITLLTFSMM